MVSFPEEPEKTEPADLKDVPKLADAMKKVCEALQPFSNEGRLRVIEAACVFLEVKPRVLYRR